MHHIVYCWCGQGPDRGKHYLGGSNLDTYTMIYVLSEAILYGDYRPGDTAVIDLDASGNQFVINLSDRRHRVSDSAPML